jgi:hypothetical protein
VSDERGRGLQEGFDADGVARETATTPGRVSDDETTPRAAKSPKPGRRALALALTLLCACAVAGLMYVGYSGRLRARVSEQAEKVRDVITGTRPPDPYTAAVLKVEEVRGEGEAIGRKAEVSVPAELKQYAEARRFLAIQEASARDAGLKPPHDFAELISQIREGGLTEAPRLGRGYVVYGVGLAATGALTHYDSARGRSVPLFADDAALKAYADGLDSERKRLAGELKETGEKLKAVDKKDKQARSQLNADAAAKRKDLAGVEDGAKSLKLYYGAPKDRAALFGEYETLSTLARDFGGRSYDLNDAASTKEFQARLLTYARPAALAVLEELGSAYQEKFARPLPVTSLVRTEEYQRTLREAGNANAGSFAVEPHTTGLAFDIYYHFMNAEEQQFVMDEIARLERDGRVEALRELRDHYHVFAFPRGVRPEEKSVEKILKGGARGKADDSEERAEETKAKSDSKAKKAEPKAKKSGARKSKDSSAPAPGRVKKGARRR